MEIVTLFPLDGSFIRLAGRMVDPALGVAVGYNHFVSINPRNSTKSNSHNADQQFAQASYVIFEATIINTVVAYWGYDQSPAILITVTLIIFLALNVYRADVFGEAECKRLEITHTQTLTGSLARPVQVLAGCRNDFLYHHCHVRRQPNPRVGVLDRISVS